MTANQILKCVSYRNENVCPMFDFFFLNFIIMETEDLMSIQYRWPWLGVFPPGHSVLSPQPHSESWPACEKEPPAFKSHSGQQNFLASTFSFFGIVEDLSLMCQGHDRLPYSPPVSVSTWL